LLPALVLFLAPFASAAQPDGWTFEAKTGGTLNAPLSAKFVMDGFPDSSFTARWTGHPYDTPFYYSYRVGRWRNGKAWEFEWLHDKLILDNPQQGVQKYQVTHGYNEWFVNRAREMSGGPIPGLIGRLGLGFVLAHPEGQVNGAYIDESGGALDGYFIAGPAAQAALEKRFALWKGLYFALEAKATLAYARIPIYVNNSSVGHVDLPNIGLHGLFGIGYAF
jgi:hypothetical protein